MKNQKVILRSLKVGDKFRWTNGNICVVNQKDSETIRFWASQGCWRIVWLTESLTEVTKI